MESSTGAGQEARECRDLRTSQRRFLITMVTWTEELRAAAVGAGLRDALHSPGLAGPKGPQSLGGAEDPGSDALHMLR